MITMLKQGKDYITDKHGIYTEYVCTSAADVANLPTGANSEAEDRPRPGSTAVVPSTDAAPHPCMCFQMSVLGCC